MRLWLDAQLSPVLADLIKSKWGIDAVAVRDLGLRDALDTDIFLAAREADAVVMTKDSDFVELLERHGPPPRVIWMRVGSSSTQRLMQIFAQTLPGVLEMLASGEPLIEIRGR